MCSKATCRLCLVLLLSFFGELSAQETQTIEIRSMNPISELEDVASVIVLIDDGVLTYAGTVVSEDGHILFCAYPDAKEPYPPESVHYVNDRTYKVTICDTVLIADKLVKHDRSGLILLKVDWNFDVSMKISDTSPGLATDVYVLRCEPDSLTGEIISNGIVSSVRNTDGVQYVQSDVPVCMMMLGGPMMNNSGELVGVISHVYEGHTIDEIGFAVNSEWALMVLKINQE